MQISRLHRISPAQEVSAPHARGWSLRGQRRDGLRVVGPAPAEVLPLTAHRRTTPSSRPRMCAAFADHVGPACAGTALRLHAEWYHIGPRLNTAMSEVEL